MCGGRWPLWPSFMAVVERAEREVVVLVGVPLVGDVSLAEVLGRVGERREKGPAARASAGTRGGTHGMSGVSGVGDASGRLMRMGCDWACACGGWLLGCGCDMVTMGP